MLVLEYFIRFINLIAQEIDRWQSFSKIIFICKYFQNSNLISVLY